MSESSNNSTLSPEQQDTAQLINRLLGQTVAARYEDFCRLSAGAFSLNAAIPIAAHVLRELESTLRGILAVPMQAVAITSPDFEGKLESARKELRALGFDDNAINEAAKKLKPSNHKSQIRAIVSQLGLKSDGDIANQWMALTASVGLAHNRSFHVSMKMDSDFQRVFAQPFDTVIRAVVVALQNRYAALMRRVEELASSNAYATAIKAFKNEIPGAKPLQWHFFQHLSHGEWLPTLIKNGLVVEPLEPIESIGAEQGFGAWPLGSYLLRMAASENQKTREHVLAAIHHVSESDHPDIIRDGLAILATLPAHESAPFANLAVEWMARSGIITSQAPNDLVKKLAEGHQSAAALVVAEELLRLWGQGRQVESHYSQHMYEHHLPALAAALLSACGLEALKLLVALLHRAETISERVNYRHMNGESIAHVPAHPYDVYDSLIGAVVHASEALVRSRPDSMHEVVSILMPSKDKTALRMVLHLLSLDPTSAPELSTSYLTDRELITQTWCKLEYASLANAWYPSLSEEQQAEILRVVDGVPDEYLTAWKGWFEEQHKVPATVDDEHRFRMASVTELLWEWRGVLSTERQEALAQSGDPNAWRARMFDDERAPPGAAFLDMQVEDAVLFLKNWQPKQDGSRHTVTALAHELYRAVVADPLRFSSGAQHFTVVKPLYIRRLLEALKQEAANQKIVEWGHVLGLVEFVYSQKDELIDSAVLAPGDDQTWEWARKAAGEMLMIGLRLGTSGIPVEQTTAVHSLVATALAAAQATADIKDFEEQFSRHPYHTCQSTSRGIAVELCILLASWNSRGLAGNGETRRAGITALPTVEHALELQLADRSHNGRIPRAIIGRYLRFLHLQDPAWLTAHMPDLFPDDDADLRDAAWLSHLGSDGGPISVLTPELCECYRKHIEDLAGAYSEQDTRDKDLHGERFASYVMVLVIRGLIPEKLLKQFELRAPASLRRKAMWFVGTEASRPVSDITEQGRARCLAYWERRLAAATAAAQPNDYSAELGTISIWCFHGVVDEWWLSDQVLAMMRIGLAPHDIYGTVQWLQKLAERHVDRAVEILSGLIRRPNVDRWNYMADHAPIRFVLREGGQKGTPETLRRVRDVVNYLASVGAPEFMDLEPLTM